MNPEDRALFFRGIAVMIFGGILVSAFPSTVSEIFLFVVSGAFIVYLTIRLNRNRRNVPALDKPLPKMLYSDDWYREARWAVVGCVFLAILMAAILLFVPPPIQCPNWRLPDKGSITTRI